MKVGGANPINAGPYNAEIGGLYRHLLAEVPMLDAYSFATDREKAQAFDDYAQRLLARLQQRHTIFPLPNQLVFDDSFLNADAILKQGWSDGQRRRKSNVYNRNTHQVAVDYIAEQLLQDATHLAEWLAMQADSVLLQAEFAEVSELEKSWLDRRLRPYTRLGEQQVDSLVTHALQLFRNCCHHYQYHAEQQQWQKQAQQLSRVDEAVLTDSLTSLIREF